VREALDLDPSTCSPAAFTFPRQVLTLGIKIVGNLGTASEVFDTTKPKRP